MSAKRWEPENTALGYNMKPVENGSFVLASAYDQLAADNKRLREALKDVHYHVESARVWNGIGWTFTGIHPSRQETIIGKIDAALSGHQK